jgi:hypothetical protein
MISAEEAQLLLSKWLSESSLLKIMFGCKEFGTDLFGQVESLSPEEVHFMTNAGRLRLTLTNAEFAYAEPREATPAIRTAEEERSICQLKLWWPSGASCLLFEARTSS